MSEIEDIKTRIRNLSGPEWEEFREWFHEFENDLWDRQIKADLKAGKFDKLIEKARQEFSQGKAKEL